MWSFTIKKTLPILYKEYDLLSLNKIFELGIIKYYAIHHIPTHLVLHCSLAKVNSIISVLGCPTIGRPEVARLNGFFFNIDSCCLVCSVILTLCESVNQYRGHLKPVKTGGLVLDNKNVILDWEKITVAG